MSRHSSPIRWIDSKAMWTGILAALAALPSIVNLWTPVLNARQAAALGAVASTLAALAAVFARSTAVEVNEKVEEMESALPAQIDAAVEEGQR